MIIIVGIMVSISNKKKQTVFYSAPKDSIQQGQMYLHKTSEQANFPQVEVNRVSNSRAESFVKYSVTLENQKSNHTPRFQIVNELNRSYNFYSKH
ncbi:MAG: hypothetical protein C0442_03420 [Chlorobiaceae bacterium]|nr:hypothetical protein [Chlorobiaceae bacterium]